MVRTPKIIRICWMWSIVVASIVNLAPKWYNDWKGIMFCVVSA
jgi:hypothetical protein